MSFRVLSASEPEWMDVLRRVPHDVYHLPGYARLTEAQESQKVNLAVVERAGDVLAMPIILRPLPAGLSGAEELFDITVPYGYPGPVASTRDVPVVHGLVSELIAGFRATSAISAFVRCHPLLGVPTEALAPFGDVIVHGDQVVIELGTADEDLAATFRENHRRNLRALDQQGFTIRVDDESDYAAFPEMYRETMRRVGADPFYLFEDGYFQSLRENLSGSTRLVAAVDSAGVPGAIAMVFVCGEIGQYHLGATAENYLRLAPVKLSILGMAQVCRDMGAKHLNLGGGVGAHEDSLFEFKLGFSKVRVPFATARFVLDEERYESLSAGSDSPEGFFPSYRHGL